MLAKLFFTRLESWVVPGENVTNGPNENHNPMDDINTDPHVWGGRVRSPARSAVCIRQ